MKNIAAILLLIIVIGLKADAQQNANGLAVQSKAPNFSAKDYSGNNIDLSKLLQSGPVVVLFYRGNWCPYCSKQLTELQDSLQLIEDKGASIVAITPEAVDGADRTIKKTKATFPIIYDKDVKIGKAYDVAYEVDTATVHQYKSNWDVDFLKINEQKDKAYLPVPAVYIINKKGVITYRYFDKDITKRPSVKELLANLN